MLKAENFPNGCLMLLSPTLNLISAPLTQENPHTTVMIGLLFGHMSLQYVETLIGSLRRKVVK